MSKKEKAVFALAEDFKAVVALVPKLEAVIAVHKEIAAGYQKYRKNGGAAIPGIEKHLGIKGQESTVPPKQKKTATIKKAEVSADATETKKTTKKVKK